MNQEIFAARRKEFLKRLGNGTAILFAAPHAKRNDDVHYEYRTSSYFYYLTGFKEQEAAAVFAPNSDKPFQLFVMPKNPEMEMWEGKRVGVDGAKTLYGADATFPIAELEKVF
ncbi:MAG: aminopeptidase P N-terminal domain-containing protein, partial [Bdellovibrionota bacterium]